MRLKDDFPQIGSDCLTRVDSLTLDTTSTSTNRKGWNLKTKISRAALYTYTVRTRMEWNAQSGFLDLKSLHSLHLFKPQSFFVCVLIVYTFQMSLHYSCRKSIGYCVWLLLHKILRGPLQLLYLSVCNSDIPNDHMSNMSFTTAQREHMCTWNIWLNFKVSFKTWSSFSSFKWHLQKWSNSPTLCSGVDLCWGPKISSIVLSEAATFPNEVTPGLLRLYVVFLSLQENIKHRWKVGKLKALSI